MEWIKRQPTDKAIGSWRYAYGRIAELENALLNADQIARLFSASDVSDFRSMLQEFGYGGDNLDDVLARKAVEDDKMLEDVSPEARYQNRFLLINDAHNLKALARVMWTAEEPFDLRKVGHLIISPFTVEPEDILKELRGEERVLPEMYVEWLDRAHDVWLRTYETAQIDRVIDQALWRELMKDTEEDPSHWFSRWFTLTADLINLEMILRGNRLAIPAERVTEALLPEGHLLHSELIAGIGDTQALVRYLNNSPYESMIPAVEGYAERGGASDYNAAADHMKADLLKEARMMPPGPERVYAYYLGRRMERDNIRLARACLLNRIAPDRARSMMRPAAG